jgi:hypothetical protein
VYYKRPVLYYSDLQAFDSMELNQENLSYKVLRRAAACGRAAESLSRTPKRARTSLAAALRHQLEKARKGNDLNSRVASPPAAARTATATLGS